MGLGAKLLGIGDGLTIMTQYMLLSGVDMNLIWGFAKA
jgi:hypothetical protein